MNSHQSDLVGIFCFKRVLAHIGQPRRLALADRASCGLVARRIAYETLQNTQPMAENCAQCISGVRALAIQPMLSLRTYLSAHNQTETLYFYESRTHTHGPHPSNRKLRNVRR